MVGGLCNHHEDLYLGYLPTIETTAYVPAVHRDTVPRPVLPVSVARNKLGARVIPYTPASRPGRGCWQIWGNSFQIFFRYFNHPIQIAGLTEAGQTAAWFWFHGQLKNDARLLAQCGHKTTHHGEHSGRSFYK